MAAERGLLGWANLRDTLGTGCRRLEGKSVLRHGWQLRNVLSILVTMCIYGRSPNVKILLQLHHYKPWFLFYTLYSKLPYLIYL